MSKWLYIPALSISIPEHAIEHIKHCFDDDGDVAGYEIRFINRGYDYGVVVDEFADVEAVTAWLEVRS